MHIRAKVSFCHNTFRKGEGIQFHMWNDNKGSFVIEKLPFDFSFRLWYN
ncbi:hypothetical protein BREVNS_1425 [Brevinematales bacterium NS]|nr:hypothetical protein BREVNS_1425 [Brevinematales bacterium NS]